MYMLIAHTFSTSAGAVAGAIYWNYSESNNFNVNETVYMCNVLNIDIHIHTRSSVKMNVCQRADRTNVVDTHGTHRYLHIIKYTSIYILTIVVNWVERYVYKTSIVVSFACTMFPYMIECEEVQWKRKTK